MHACVQDRKLGRPFSRAAESAGEAPLRRRGGPGREGGTARAGHDLGLQPPHLVALRGGRGAVQALVLEAAQAHVVADDVQHAHHLAEDQHPAAGRMVRAHHPPSVTGGGLLPSQPAPRRMHPSTKPLQQLHTLPDHHARLNVSGAYRTQGEAQCSKPPGCMDAVEEVTQAAGVCVCFILQVPDTRKGARVPGARLCPVSFSRRMSLSSSTILPLVTTRRSTAAPSSVPLRHHYHTIT